MSLNEILNGIEKVVSPYIGGIGQFFRILFTTPTIAGLTIGGWLLFFTAMGIIFGGVHRD